MPSSSSSSLAALKRAIAVQKRIVDSLPLCSSRKEWDAKAKHIYNLSQKEEEYDLILESHRVAEVVKTQEEQHPPLTEECPICLEMKPNNSLDSMRYFYCCGNGICKECSLEADSKAVCLRTCLICQSDRPFKDDVETKRQMTIKHAERGKPWAQINVGVGYRDGSGGFPLNEMEALKWFERAAEQNNPYALRVLGVYYARGDIVQQSFVKTRELVKEAADLGYIEAQELVGAMYLTGQGGEADEEKAVHYYTLAYSHGNVAAAFQLGHWFRHGGCGLTTSLYRAKHYFEEAAQNGNVRSYVPLAATMLDLCNLQYQERSTVPGYSVIPKVFFWARKAHESGDAEGTKWLKLLENEAQEYCANCDRHHMSFGQKLKCCTRCKAVWYCGRKCQLDHWKAGHKVDCIKKE